jgi:hypothetical protein
MAERLAAWEEPGWKGRFIDGFNHIALKEYEE